MSTSVNPEAIRTDVPAIGIASKASMRAQAEQIKGQFVNAAADINVLDDAVALLGANVDGIQNTVTVQGNLIVNGQTRLTDLEAADATITGRLTAAEGTITNLQATDATISGNLTAATGRITTLEGNDASFAGQLTALAATVDNLQVNNTINVGGGANLLANSAADQGLDWVATLTTSPSVQSVLSVHGPGNGTNIWAPTGANAFQIAESSSGLDENTQWTDAFFMNPATATSAHPVEPGKTIEFSCYTGAQRCKVQILMVWRDSAGATVSTLSSNTLGTNDAEALGGNSFSAYKRLVIRGAVPANARTVWFVVRKFTTKAGQTNSFAFFTRGWTGEVPAGQTIPTPWAAGGLTKIGPGSITTGTLITDSAQIGQGVIRNANIDNASIDTLKIQGGSVGTQIYAQNTLTFNGLISETNIASITVPATAANTRGPVFLQASCLLHLNVDRPWTFFVRRGGVLVRSLSYEAMVPQGASAWTQGPIFAFSQNDVPEGGATYTISIAGGNNITVGNQVIADLVVIENKR